MKEKIRIETYKRADGKYGIAIHKKEKNGWLISYVGSWEGEFGTKDVFALSGKYKKC